MTKPRTVRYLTLSDIHDFVQQVARYDLLKTARFTCGLLFQSIQRIDQPDFFKQTQIRG